MPRLTDHDYLKNHELLRASRETDNAAFVLLSAGEQWDLFRYYLPHEARSYSALLAHRAEISNLDPSLPHRAGRALTRMLRIKALLPEYREWAKAQPRMQKNADKRIVIFSEVKPELDARKFAEIISRVVREKSSRSLEGGH
jgi:hypothetical protein